MGIQLGIIGFGGMAGWHTKNAPNIPGVSVVAAYDIDAVRVQTARDAGLTGYDKLSDFLKDERVNVVLVATPNDVHCEMAIKALKAGKHVICEKPPAMSVKEWDKMVAASKEAGKMLTAHQNRRWDRDFRTAMAVVKSGTLGNLFTIQSRLHGCGGVMHGWRGVVEKGGGMIYDWGVHFLDQMLQMMGYDTIKSVTCVTNSVINPEIDDYFNMIIDCEGGIRYTVEIGTYILEEFPRWFICGDEGTCVIKSFNAEEGGITKIDTLQEDKPILLQTAAGPTRTFAPRPEKLKIREPLPKVTAEWVEYYQNIVDYLDGKAELIVQPWQVRRTLQVMEAAFKSAKTGKTVMMPELVKY